MADRTVAFVCDGDRMAGLGHTSRCVGLAEAWNERGVTPLFVGPVDGAARLVTAAGFAIDPRRSTPTCSRSSSTATA